MPRNGSGTYNLPSGNPVASGATITSAHMNATLGDIANELTNSLPRDGSASLSNVLKLVDGAVSGPALTFAAETSSGLYLKAYHEVGLSVGGVAKALFTETGLNAVNIGETTRGTAKVTTLDANGAVSFGTTLGVTGNVTVGGNVSITGGLVITGTTVGLTKAMVGLANADNVSDVNKPISTAVQTVLDQFKADRRGTIFARAAFATPAGAMACDGAAYSRTTYAALFAVIGTAWGAGDGSTTFNVPDLRGEFLRGIDNGRGLDAGRAFANVQAGQLLSHTHTISDPGHAHAVYDPSHAHGAYTDAQGVHAHTYTRAHLAGVGAYATGIAGNITDGQDNVGTDGAGNHAHNVGIYGAGTGISLYAAATGVTALANGGAENRPRNVSVLYCIWY